MFVHSLSKWLILKVLILNPGHLTYSINDMTNPLCFYIFNKISHHIIFFIFNKYLYNILRSRYFICSCQNDFIRRENLNIWSRTKHRIR